MAVRPAQPHREEPALARMHRSRSSAGPSSAHGLRCHDSSSFFGRRCSADSTSNSKRTARSLTAGRLETTPTTSRSRPSSSGASQSRHAQVRQRRRPEEADGERQAARTGNCHASRKHNRQQPRPSQRRQLGLQLQRRRAGANASAARVIYNATRCSPLRLTVPRKFFRKYLPDPDAVRSSRLVRRSAPGCSTRTCGTSTAARCPARSRSACSPAWCPGRCRCWARCCSPCRCARTCRWRCSPRSTPTRSPSCRSTCSPTRTGSFLLPGEAPRRSPLRVRRGNFGESMTGSARMLALGKPLGGRACSRSACTLALLGYVAVQLGWRIWSSPRGARARGAAGRA